jgi:Fe2+ or Zn2+ uptake regulation protein
MDGMGAYKTKAREEILTYLKNHKEQRLTAKEIYEAVSKEKEGINRTTIYRNLDKLCETGELLRFKEPNQEAWYYQYSTGHANCREHIHAQCSQCGKVFHLDKPFVDTFALKVSAEYGLDMDPAKTIIVGICKKCKRK